MQLVVNSQRFTDPAYIARGGIGEIYKLANDILAKVYDLDKRSFERRQKVLALCNSFQNHVSQFGTNRYAFPEHPAYDLTVSFDTLAGFSMRNFGGIPTIAELGFDLAANSFRESKGVKFDNSLAIGFVYQIFEWVDLLHRARIILGDVNDGNFLYSPHSKRPVIVDIDSVQIGQFPCIDVTPDFMCPELKNRGASLSGGYIFDSGTDIFAVASVCYEFLIGAKPHYVFVNPPKSANENKDIGVSNIGCFVKGRSFVSTFGLAYVDVPQNRLVEQRLSWLKLQDKRLLDFFVSIFVNNERNNLLSTLPVNDQRHPGYHFLVESGFKKVVDDLVQQRSQPPAIPTATQHKQTAPLPDSGFRSIIDSLSGKPAAKAKAPKAGGVATVAIPKADPPQLAAFLKQFNLST